MLVQNKILITNGRSSVAIRSRPVHAPFDSFAFPSRIFFSHNFFAVWKRNSSYNLVSTSHSQGSVRSFSLPLFPKWTLTRKKLFLFLYRFRYLPRCLRVFYFLLHFFFLMNFYTRNYNWFHWRYTREEYLGKKRKKKKSRILRSPSLFTRIHALDRYLTSSQSPVRANVLCTRFFSTMK